MLGNPQSVLTKITPERSRSLMEQVKHLNINTKEKLNGAIDLIVEQAMSEPASCATYANMCRELMGEDDRSLGLKRFIGELFKLEILNEPIMHECLEKLLNNCHEDSVECLCKLLSTCGKRLDTEEAKVSTEPQMDRYFNYIIEMMKEGQVSSRVNFLLQDLVQLKMVNIV
ncbi:Eukaryotic translation initiation factor 4 gamma 1 [Takifugu flavidus]|uniref:Eukaryotic translation initiation factor 4 gamma 1 n=1 Tax=Takifugu flavidus TaxID=433684 RepID=A0A5C6PBB5_9TELE|nr:Eukaryotic translation initiation factor 4 gamma 1 [Takifugu flavidus]TWW77064.1 Eukaryotic translation initiation factor 4 gamma 1 [Takifugu flavidus]